VTLTTHHRLQGVPTPTDVHEQLTDILVRVVDCPADAVVPHAKLKEDLGVDSLTIVEVGEELGRRFDVYLSDDTIDNMKTVYDAINAVVRHDGSTQPAELVRAPALSRPPGQFAAPAAGATSASVAARQLAPEVVAKRRSKAMTAAIWFGLVGAGIGAIFGLGGAALVGASGIGNVNLPPITLPTTAPTTATPTPTPTPTPTDNTEEPQPTLNVSSTHVSPGQHFTLEGAFPALNSGATLQVQVKDGDAAWDDFPITTKTKAGGKYKTEIYTSRTGSRQFRVLHRASGKSSPAVTVEIG
jgi:acyl carrier protein